MAGKTGDAGAAHIFGAHRVAGALRRHHADVHVGARLDQVEMDVEAVGEEQRRALLHVGLKVLLPDAGLELVGGQQHDHVGPFGGLGNVHDLEASLLGLGRGFGAGAQGNGDVGDARIAQVQRVRVALAAIADDGDLLTLDQIEIGIPIVIDAHATVPLP